MGKLLSTRQVAEYLGVNEKMVYTLILEKGLPATVDMTFQSAGK